MCVIAHHNVSHVPIILILIFFKARKSKNYSLQKQRAIRVITPQEAIEKRTVSYLTTVDRVSCSLTIVIAMGVVLSLSESNNEKKQREYHLT